MIAKALRWILRRLPLDNCEYCYGIKGGAKGNENIIDGVVTCDYCHALMTREHDRRSWTE